jgi:hypothetical protein
MIGYTVYELDARVKRAADALVESGHHVDLFVTDHAGSRASNSELLTIHRLQMKKRRSAAMRYAYEYGFFGAWAFVLVSLLHARRRYDIVYVHNMPNFLVFAGCLPKLRGAKIVLIPRPSCWRPSAAATCSAGCGPWLPPRNGSACRSLTR